jgi:hypothetical protein
MEYRYWTKDSAFLSQRLSPYLAALVSLAVPAEGLVELQENLGWLYEGEIGWKPSYRWKDEKNLAEVSSIS